MSDNLEARLWAAERSTPEDLRAKGLMVAAHNDYMLNGVRHALWMMSIGHGARVTVTLIGEGRSDAEALDKIRAKYAELTDFAHHAPMCPANHYHGTRAPTYRCSCGATPVTESNGAVIDANVSTIR